MLEYLNVIKTTAPRAATILWIVVWAYILLMALLRRLVINDDGIEYSTEANKLKVKWSEVRYIENRKSFANLWFAAEGLVIRTDLPDAKEHFVELTQFGGRHWRTGSLGAVLQLKAPQLFSGVESNQ